MPKQTPTSQIKSSQELLLVDFYADWCGPCQTMNPILEQALSNLKKPLKILKINVDKHPELSRQFGIRSIPHYLLMKRGKILWRKSGLITQNELTKALQGFL